MKTILLIAGACCIQLYTVWAQPTHPIRVKTESEASKAIPAHDKYRYATFSQGSVSYINGQVATARLNYNLLLGEMQFIDPKGDTLSVANEYTLALITIGKDLFYYDSHHGCLEVIADYTSVKLARQYLLKIMRSEKEGAYGQSSAVSSIKTYNSYATRNSQVHKLTPKGDILFSREVAYFLIDQNKRSYKASKSTILTVFAKHKTRIGQYIKEESIDFTKEEDLKKLLQFCIQQS